MGSAITDEQRKEYEKFIELHPPYEDDDPILQVFDHPDVDKDRLLARMMKSLLDGKIT